jgi:hypothetical protein
MSNSSITLIVDDQGVITAIYDDRLAVLIDQGDATITRASHVEPQDGGWCADMSPIGSNVRLGPYKLRQEALDAEVEYLSGLLFS